MVEYKVRRIIVPVITEEAIVGGEPEWSNTELTGKHLERAFVSFNPNDIARNGKIGIIKLNPKISVKLINIKVKTMRLKLFLEAFSLFEPL